MNEVKNFNYAGLEVTAVLIENEPWFVAKNVCDVLESANSARDIQRLDEDEKLMYTMCIAGQNRQTWLINESGLYELILTSRKPQAKPFKNWVKKEVLPSIRKHGAYMTETALEQAVANPDFMIGLLSNLKAEQEKSRQLETINNKNKPLVAFAEMCMESEDSLLVREVAKLCQNNGFNIGEKRLFAKLREWGLIFKHKNEPMQQYIDSKHFSLSQKVREIGGEKRTFVTMRVTPKGQKYILQRLSKENRANSIDA